MIRLVLLFLVLALPVQAQEFPALYAVTGVATDDVLNIRSQPDAGSEIIGKLDPDATGVEVLRTIGNWALVNTDEGSGYASLRFLQRETGPGWNSLERRLSCLGTEPFWSLDIDPNAGSAVFSTPESADSVRSIGTIWPGTALAPAAALSLSDGMAVLFPAQCSDGMSDRSYGIAVDLFLTDPAGSRLSGCCLVSPP